MLLTSAAVLFFSCSDEKKESKVLSTDTTASVNLEELGNNFNTAWNKKDSAAIVNMMADDVLMLSGKEKFAGKKEVADKWVHYNMPVSANLKIDPLQGNTSSGLAYGAGTWSLDVNVPGKPARKASGNHTMVWKKQKDDSWKMVLINIENHITPPAEPK
jgi:ketosteroid isomerase-like protein